MFSKATVNPMEAVITKATDENLTSENWELILNVCDKVNADHENGAKNAILALQKRLAHRNANVQLYSLSMAEALSKNCGSAVQREIASRAFTQSLTRLINDRTIHSRVKARAGQLIKQWTNDFKNDPSLGMMSETYRALKAQGVSMDPPSKPQKQAMSEADRRQEEEELQMALAMSLTETKISDHNSSNQRNTVDNGPNPYTLPSSNNNAYTLPTPSQNQYVPQQQQPAVAERTAATVSRVRGLYDFVASEPGELSFRRGEVITVIESAYKDWWRGSLHGVIGIFPTNYVENLPEPTPADLQRESEEEMKVFAEAKNVERLLAVLSSAGPNDPSIAENEQLQNLYHSTIQIRPKLVRLIEKYAQKKDDLILLNEKFMKARREYDELMEASLARYQTAQHYSAPAYGRNEPNGAARMPSGAYQQQSPAKPNGDHRAAGQTYHGLPHAVNAGIASGPYPAATPQTSNNTGGRVPQRNSQPSNPGNQYAMTQTDISEHHQPQGSVIDQARLPSDPYGQVNSTNQLHQDTSHIAQASPPYPQADQAHTSSQGYKKHTSYNQEPSQPPESPVSEHHPSYPISHDVPGTYPSSSQQQLPTTPGGTYNHERADREGGPPIAYFEPAPVYDDNDEATNYYRRSNNE